MKIHVRQRGNRYTITLIDETNILQETTVTTVEERDKLIWELTDTFNIIDIEVEDTKSKKTKLSEAPSIPVFDEEDATDFFEENEELVYSRILQAVNEGIKANLKVINLFELNGTGVHITSQRKDWKSGLQDALDYYLAKENYEACTQIRELIAIL